MKDWITLNEPLVTSIEGYGTGSAAPGITNIGTDVYTTAHHQIQAHAKAYRNYYANYAATQNGNFRTDLMYIIANKHV